MNSHVEPNLVYKLIDKNNSSITRVDIVFLCIPLHDFYDDVWMKLLKHNLSVLKMQNLEDFKSRLQKFWKNTWMEVEMTERESWITTFSLS